MLQSKLYPPYFQAYSRPGIMTSMTDGPMWPSAHLGMTISITHAVQENTTHLQTSRQGHACPTGKGIQCNTDRLHSGQGFAMCLQWNVVPADYIGKLWWAWFLSEYSCTHVGRPVDPPCSLGPLGLVVSMNNLSTFLYRVSNEGTYHGWEERSWSLRPSVCLSLSLWLPFLSILFSLLYSLLLNLSDCLCGSQSVLNTLFKYLGPVWTDFKRPFFKVSPISDRVVQVFVEYLW